MTGIIKVDTIQNNGGTTALTIDSSGRVTLGVPVYVKCTGNNTSLAAQVPLTHWTWTPWCFKAHIHKSK